MDNQLTVIEQKEVAFYNDSVIAVRAEDGDVYVPLRPICELLGVSWQGQNQRINRDVILTEVTRSVNVRFTEPNRTRHIAMKCLPLKYLNGWLFGINPQRTKPEVKERLLQYQRDCYQVLSDAFQGGLESAESIIDDIVSIDPEAAEALAIAEAVVKMARSHARLLQRVAVNEDRHSSAEIRLDALEAELGNPDRLISQSQQMEISQAVKAIGHELTKRSGRNEFGGVYGELYRRFEVSSYKQLPAAKHAEAMKFLDDWYSGLTGDKLPF